MKLIHAATELEPRGRKICLALGFFDGVHLGHQHILRQTIADARRHEAVALVTTFDRHPNSVVAPGRVPPLIYSLPQKLGAIESLDVDALLLIHFDKAFSEQTGQAFIHKLARDLGAIQSVCVGADFVFGHKRSGDVALLRKLGQELGFEVHGVAAVSLNGHVVSSTRIREAIHAGKLDAAGQMLGRAYSLSARVIKGDGLGRQFGFPTANLEITGLVLPPNGVYAAHARAAGKTHRAVLNIGHRPTLHGRDPAFHFEVHLLDFSGDLYDQTVEVTFAGKLRDEKKFPSPDALKAQIACDIAEAARRF
jgi:riboflavin kinase / FMN adenylyltransferase